MSREYKDSWWQEVLTTLSDQTRDLPARGDWSVLVDVRARIWKGLKFGLRWSYSIAPIRKLTYVTVKTNGDTDSWTSNFHNHTISLRLMYIFNEKFVKNEKGKWTKDISKSPWDK